MKLSLNWIKEFTSLPGNLSGPQLAQLLTLRTCEVEGIEDLASTYANMIVGKVLKIRPHPNADKLRLVDTDIGGKTVQIVCGGENLYEGMFVAVGLPGARVIWHGQGDPVHLEETAIRGEKSFGMICHEEEIFLPVFTPQKGNPIADLKYGFRYFGVKPSREGTPLAQALELDDVVFEIDNKSLTHRPDLWGHYGMAREFAAFLNGKLKKIAPKNVFPESGEQLKVELQSGLASRFMCAVFTGIKIGQSPRWLARRLEAVGMRPVNNIVDITNFVMHELGHPLHAFDRRTVQNDSFVIRFAEHGEKLETLDHKVRQLYKEDMLVTNGERSLGIAGVMGGLNSEISNDTTEIILEAACWNPILLRKTSQRHAIRSDAAQRFEKSLDPELTGLAFRRAAELVVRLCKGARASGPPTDVYPVPAGDKLPTVLLNTDRVSKKIGAAVSTKEIIQILKKLGFGVARENAAQLKVAVPSFRATKDVSIEDDLIEEVARMYGYEKIAPEVPRLPAAVPMENSARRYQHRIRELLSYGLGFTECMRYSFYGRGTIEQFALPEKLHLEVENPLSQDQTHLRISLMPNLWYAALENLARRDSVSLYEIGNTYIKRPDDYFPQEDTFVCAAVVRKKGDAFKDALGAASSLLERFPTIKFTVRPSENPPPYAHPNACAEIVIEEGVVATVYDVNPAVLKKTGVDLNISAAAFELNFTFLAALGQREVLYAPIPRFPGITIDVSVLAAARTPVKTLHELIARADGLIRTVELLGIFEHESLGADKKSATFRVLLQSPDRTLTDEEMKIAQEKIFGALQSSGFAIR